MSRGVSVTSLITYEEEDGFEIVRGTSTFYVLGSCEADYKYYFCPGCMYERNGDPGYPDEESLERVSSLICEVTSILDEEGNEVCITLTPEEKELFDNHMSAKLDDEANDHDFHDDYEDVQQAAYEDAMEYKREQEMMERHR